MAIPIPVRSSDISVSWMEAALADHLHGSSITSVQCSRLSDPGQTSEALDVTVEYADGSCTLPRRFIAKLGSNDPEVLGMIDMFGQYRREVAFYQEFPDAGIPKPQSYYSACSSDGLKMVLLMEHLAPATSSSWKPSLAEIELALNHLPAFHAKWWNVPELKHKSCLIQTRDQTFIDSFAAGAASAEAALAIHGDNAAVSVACVVAANEKIGKLQAYLEGRNFTIVHADYHGKQMFMPTDSAGKFSVIDWQFPYAAEGAWDFTRLLGLCLRTSDWEQHGERLIDAYHDGLVRNGVADYSRNELIDGIRMGLIFTGMVQAISNATTDTGILEKECDALGLDWKDVWFTRHNRMMTDLDAKAFIDSI